uniref:Uncharacterized protein n=1 Tax=Aegilops tauschii subsp. strangulata TaxID=200361 RepID=A0A453HQ20_AEGTS
MAVKEAPRAATLAHRGVWCAPVRLHVRYNGGLNFKQRIPAKSMRVFYTFVRDWGFVSDREKCIFQP